MALSNVCLPMQLHAFILNGAVADDPEAKIAPIAQPNYTFLRLNEQVIQNDILDHADLHYTSPRGNNSRVTDLGSGQPLNKRFGAYISWVIPRAYRSGTAASNPANAKQRKQQQGYPTDTPGTPDYSVPDFRAVPTRWLVVRHVDTTTVTPALSPTEAERVQCRSWVIESDRQWDLDSIAPDKDLQVDYSPFTASSRTNATSDVEQQAEVFIGNKTDATKWTEDDPRSQLVLKKRIKPLSLLNSSNQLFADYQPHNSNVFSMLDDFSYVNDLGDDTVMQLATASYYVLGWHSDSTEDPFYMLPETTTQQIRLTSLMMDLQGSGDKGHVDNWLSAQTAAQCLCHGAVYNVAWNANSAPTVVPAKDAAAQLTKCAPNIPISIGYSPTDALITYVAAHQNTDSGIVQELEKDLWSIQTLLRVQDDGADAQLEAKDLLYNYGYARTAGGTEWHMSGASDGVLPTTSQQSDLIDLYNTQLALDNALRTLRYLQWQLFSVWWKYVSGAYEGDPITVASKVSKEIATPLVNRISALLGLGARDPTNTIAWLKGEQTRLTGKLPVEQGAAPGFYQQKDPTLMVGGIDAGWAVDYLDKLNIRLGFQIPTYHHPPDPMWSEFDTPTGSSGLLQKIVPRLPEEVQATALSLLREFQALKPSVTDPHIDSGAYLPLYHDQGPANPNQTDPPPPTAPWRDRWNGQPWFPLFVEWEAEYFHIPFEDFDLSSRPENDSASAQNVLRYGIVQGKKLMNTVSDVRNISGRILLLPQPSFSLKSAVTQLFHNMRSADLDKYLSESERNILLNQIGDLAYLSHPLSGLTDHLTTRVQGTHIKPTQRPPGEKITAMDAAATASQAAGIGETEILLLQAETNVTPYGRNVTTVAYGDPGTLPPPMKLVNHGQLRFTALNVIDKFGQAICALDPNPVPQAQLPHVAPALSDIYVCQEAEPGVPNVVDSGIAPPACEFVQLTPSINQPTRLNSYFIKQDPDNSATWRPVYDWESPIWGWVVVNYVESALQLFLPDGTFYREIVLGGVNKDTVSPAFTPFAKDVSESIPKQLDDLVTQLKDEDYLDAFFTMIDGAFANLPPTDDAYAQYMNSIIGKPLALVNAGFSLELGTPPLQNESTLNYTPVDRTLLPLNTPVLPTGQDWNVQPVPAGTLQYSFKIKLGDDQRTYDGLVGYFKAFADDKSAFDMSTIFTYWNDPKFPNTTVAISPGNYPPLAATHVLPDMLVDSTTPLGGTKAKTREQIFAERNANISDNVFACIVDPYTAMHIYTGILPIQSLKLPEWTMESAMNNMTAFFKVGPVLVTKDVPAWNKDMPSHILKPTDPPGKVLAGSEVAVPSVGKAGWAWLQPYDEPIPKSLAGSKANGKSGAVGSSGDKIDIKPPPYIAMGVGKVDSRPRFEDSPYTVLEGYLRQTGPLMKPPAPPPQSTTARPNTI